MVPDRPRSMIKSFFLKEKSLWIAQSQQLGLTVVKPPDTQVSSSPPTERWPLDRALETEGRGKGLERSVVPDPQSSEPCRAFQALSTVRWGGSSLSTETRSVQSHQEHPWQTSWWVKLVSQPTCHPFFQPCPTHVSHTLRLIRADLWDPINSKASFLEDDLLTWRL